jgi:hypothetical protein
MSAIEPIGPERIRSTTATRKVVRRERESDERGPFDDAPPEDDQEDGEPESDGHVDVRV